MIRFLCAILLVFLIIYGGCSRDFKEVLPILMLSQNIFGKVAVHLGKSRRSR